MASSVTIKDVARAADVSVGTVSRVLNHHANVTDDLRQRVLQVATELGYAPAVILSGEVRAPRTIRSIGFVYSAHVDGMPATINPYWSQILQGVERAVADTGIQVTYQRLRAVGESPLELRASLQVARLDGILLLGMLAPAVIEQYSAARIPLVLVDNYLPGLPVDTVLVDNFEGGRQATEHLISAGHRSIAFLGIPPSSGPRPLQEDHTVAQRFAGYCAALIDAGLPAGYELYQGASKSVEGGYAACKALLARGVGFTALFCATDLMAAGALRALREAGYRVPDDVSLVGFDDIDLAEHLTPALTTVRVDKMALGAIAVQSLLAQAAAPESTPVARLLDITLVKRESVGPPALNRKEVQ